MAIETPAYWDEDETLLEKVLETTAYGNPVMIPKRYQSGWESARMMQEYCKKKGEDPLTCWQESDPMRPRAYDMMMVYWELYREHR